MASEIDVINNGLGKIGEAPITSLTEGTPAARLANRSYADIRDALLRDYQWNFATKRVSLAASTTIPIWEFDNSFVVPPDFLRLISLENLRNQDYRIERTSDGTVINTDIAAPLKIKYVAQVTDPEVMDPSFREALSARLALEWSEAITGSQQQLTNLSDLYRQKIGIARTIDGNEEYTQSTQPNDWIDARN